MKKRACVYVDGFNLYHGICSLEDNRLKWLDLMELACGLCGADEEVIAVYYFTAHAKWKGDEAIKRQRDYIRALKARGVIPVIGTFKSNTKQCKRCNAEWQSHDEKESDVHLAIHIIKHAFEHHFDHAILVTGDSDQAPTLRMAKQIYPSAQYSVWTPPNRFFGCDSLGKRKEIRRARLESCLLPDRLYAADGIAVINIPSKYRFP